MERLGIKVERSRIEVEISRSKVERQRIEVGRPRIEVEKLTIKNPVLIKPFLQAASMCTAPVQLPHTPCHALPDMEYLCGQRE